MDRQHLGGHGARAAPSGHGRTFARSPGCEGVGTLGRVLRHELAAEGAGEDALFEAVQKRERTYRLTLNALTYWEKALKAINITLLLCGCWNPQLKDLEPTLVDYR